MIRRRLLSDAKTNRPFKRVLDALDHLDRRLNGHTTEKRRHDRRSFRTLVTFYLKDPAGGETSEHRPIHVWARNISQSGMSFIYPDSLSDSDFIVALGTDESNQLYFRATTVRCREVPEAFWKIAVEFQERVPQPGTDSPSTDSGDEADDSDA